MLNVAFEQMLLILRAFILLTKQPSSCMWVSNTLQAHLTIISQNDLGEKYVQLVKSVMPFKSLWNCCMPDNPHLTC